LPKEVGNVIPKESEINPDSIGAQRKRHRGDAGL